MSLERSRSVNFTLKATSPRCVSLCIVFFKLLCRYRYLTHYLLLQYRLSFTTATVKMLLPFTPLLSIFSAFVSSEFWGFF